MGSIAVLGPGASVEEQIVAGRFQEPPPPPPLRTELSDDERR
jgi:hypothetical protein